MSPMVDRVTKEKRSEIMRSVKSKNTTPEMTVRKLVFSMGYRYRLHRRDLPGSPDMVFPGRKKVIFVHGCFWHGHSCKKGMPPKSRLDYWLPKITENRERDRKALIALRRNKWKVLVVWQCQIGNFGKLKRRLRNWLDRNHSSDSTNAGKYL